MTNTVPAPLPVAPTDDSAAFWRGVAEHRLLLQRCEACGRHRFPPMPSCPWCAATAATIVEAVGTGTVYSWIVVHRAFDERFAADTPYTIATIDLVERCRMFARLDVEPAALSAGQPVVAHYVDHDGWTEVRFSIAAGAS